MNGAPEFSLTKAMDDLVVSAAAGKLRANDAGFVERIAKQCARRVDTPVENVLSVGQRRMLVDIWQRMPS